MRQTPSCSLLLLTPPPPPSPPALLTDSPPLLSHREKYRKPQFWGEMEKNVKRRDASKEEGLSAASIVALKMINKNH